MSNRMTRSGPRVEIPTAIRASWRGWQLGPNFWARGIRDGRHLGQQRGGGEDFHAYRPFVPGEDAAHLDWKRYIRSRRLYVRQPEPRHQLATAVMLDTSDSMAFAGLDRAGQPRGDRTPKAARAREAVSLWATLMLQGGDRVGLIHGDTVMPPTGQWDGLARLNEALAARTPTMPPAAMLQRAVAALSPLPRPRRPDLLVIVSDLLDPLGPLGDPLAQLARGGTSVLALQVLTPQEVGAEPLPDAALQLVDPDGPASLDTSPSAYQAAYQAQAQAHIHALHQLLAKHGGRCHTVLTTQDVLPQLRPWLTRG